MAHPKLGPRHAQLGAAHALATPLRLLLSPTETEIAMFISRLLALALLGLVLLAPSVRAQDTLTHKQEPVRHHHISVELGGNGGLYTLNYERRLTPLFAARAGLEYFPVVDGEDRDTDVALVAPIVLSFVPEVARLWGAPLSAEVGAGFLVVYASGTETVYASREDFLGGIGTKQDFRKFGVAPTAVAAFRLYVASERVALRAGIAALPNRSEWNGRGFILWPMLSVGYRF